MVRAKAAFATSRLLKRHTVSEAAADPEEGVDIREIFSEFQVGEDFEMGSRLQAAGFKSVFIDQKLATGEVRTAGGGSSSEHVQAQCSRV